MVLLEEVVDVFPRKEAGCFSRKAREAGNAEAEEGKRERPNGRKSEAGSHFPGRDAGDGENGRVDRGVEGKEGGKIGLELGDASQVADPGENALADERRADQLGRRMTAGRGLEALVVMAETIRWRYSRVPAGHPRIMHPS